MPLLQNSPGYGGTKRHRRDGRREWPERAGQAMAEPARCDSEGGEFRQERKQGGGKEQKKCCGVERTQKKRLEDKQGSSSLIKKLRKKTAVCT